MSSGNEGDDGGPRGEENSIRIRVAIPAINHENIELWFIQLDHWFQVNGITSDKNKFSTVVAALDSRLLAQIFDVVNNPPATDRFKAIKSALTKNFADSEQRRIKQFVSGLQLGDRKPSHLLNDLRRVGGETQDEKLLRGLWMQRLPVEVQTCLATVDTPLSDLAILADSVMEIFRIGNNSSGASINAASTSNPSRPTSTIDDLRKEVRELAKQLAKITASSSGNGNRSRSRSRNGRNQTPARTSTENSDTTECWYHQVYGENAQKCREPCSRATHRQKN